MFDRKGIKAYSKKRLKKHYWLYVVACMLAFLLGFRYTIAVNIIKITAKEGIYAVKYIHPDEISEKLLGYDSDDAVEVFANVATGNIESGRELSHKISNNNRRSSNRYFKAVEMGYKDGVLAQIANTLSSGHIFVAVFSGIRSLVDSDSTAMAIFIILSLLVIFFIWAAVLNVYRAVYRRIFLEGHLYDKVPIKSFIHFFRLKKYLKAVRTMLMVSVLRFLWAFTIVGGFVKYYSYFLVPYIIAENPDISPFEAIKLSKRMMKGHKMECFCLAATFSGWYLLDFFTLGIVGLLFLNPYKEAFFAEYYIYIRELSKKSVIEDTERLNDRYLFEKADEKTLALAYEDILKLSEKPDQEIVPGNSVWRFFANNFGIVPTYSDTEKAYFEQNLRKLKIASFKSIMDGQTYPGRLNPVPEKKKQKKLEFLNVKRHYSICSLIMIFFILSFAGWLWEVCFHLVTDAEFVKRGILQGAWLPIYGSGGLMILIFLNKLRERPVIQFIVSIVLCGTVEYFTAFLLENLYGEKWWDYNGYFMNINGRVCAEGLIFFGLGGAAIVYFVAPIADNFLRRIRLRFLMPVCVCLTILLSVDITYSFFNPNVGEGITEYKIPTACVDYTEY